MPYTVTNKAFAPLPLILCKRFTTGAGTLPPYTGTAKKCCDKKTHRTENEKKLLNNRLNRIEGQIKGVKKMISEDAYCNDILVQLSAIENSVKSLSNLLLEKHLYTCIARDLENGKIDTIDEIVSLFKRFNKG